MAQPGQHNGQAGSVGEDSHSTHGGGFTPVADQGPSLGSCREGSHEAPSPRFATGRHPTVTDDPSPGSPAPSSFPTEDHLPLALTINEASQLLRLDPRTIRAMLTARELDGNRRGHAIRVSRASVLEWLSGKRRVSRSRR